MRLRWLGHSCFLVSAPGGGRLLLDPYRSGAYGGAVGHAPVRERVDVLCLTHEHHEDHAGAALLPGAPLVIKAPGEVTAGEFRITSRWADHDGSGGRRLGRTLVHKIEAGAARLAHLGDLGGALPPSLVSMLRDLDALLVPVGGAFTLGPEEAARLIRRLRPRIAIPMHYRSAKVTLPLASVEEFAAAAGAVEHAGGSEIDIAGGVRTGRTRIVIPEAAL